MGTGGADAVVGEQFHVPLRLSSQRRSVGSVRAGRSVTERTEPDMTVMAVTANVITGVLTARLPVERMSRFSDRAGYASFVEACTVLCRSCGGDVDGLRGLRSVRSARVGRLRPGVRAGTADALVTIEVGDNHRVLDVQLRADGRRGLLTSCWLL
ncbi:hypothetical protein [Stackebrandtia soli]|uniref:hypothetical protein n=1 Tax=Stackebrandtia soli TaxID=1892856 RepID=UPI0039EB3122